MGSQVAEILARIEHEQRAAWSALYGVSVVAPHRVITARMERIGRDMEQLKELIGEKQAVEQALGAMERGSQCVSDASGMQE